MKAFQFPLQKALDLRQTQFELAQALVERKLALLLEIDRERAGIEAAGERSELEVRQLPCIEGRDLTALAGFRLAIRARSQALAAKRVECQKELASRQAVLLEARRRCRLLERLKERRLTEWQSAADKELEELAADSYMAQWARVQKPEAREKGVAAIRSKGTAALADGSDHCSFL
jgi:hypothetical protein